MRVLVDTGALVAATLPRDQYHQRAVSLGRALLDAGGLMVSTTLILAELHTHFLRRLGPGTARGIMDGLLVDPGYEWIDVPVGLIRDASTTWLARFRDQPFSLTDAVSFEVMKREKLTTAFAFDRDFVTAGFRLLG